MIKVVPAQRKLPWTAEELATMNTMIDDGRTIHEIAGHFGRSKKQSGSALPRAAGTFTLPVCREISQQSCLHQSITG